MEEKYYYKNFEENQKKEIRLLQDILHELKENNKYNIPMVQSITKVQMQIQLIYQTIKDVIGGLGIFNTNINQKEVKI